MLSLSFKVFKPSPALERLTGVTTREPNEDILFRYDFGITGLGKTLQGTEDVIALLEDDHSCLTVEKDGLDKLEEQTWMFLERLKRLQSLIR